MLANQSTLAPLVREHHNLSVAEATQQEKEEAETETEELVQLVTESVQDSWMYTL